MASNRGAAAWRRRQAAAQREAAHPLSRAVRETIDHWRRADELAEFVYFIQEEGVPEFVKIGVAVHPATRLATLQTGNPRRLVLDVVLYSHLGGEQAIHMLWAEHRLRGEWFTNAPQIIAWASWAAATQRERFEADADLLEVARLGNFMPSVWLREQAA